MGAPPLPPVTATLDELAARGPLHVCRDGALATLAVKDGTELWGRTSTLRDSAREYTFVAYRSAGSTTADVEVGPAEVLSAERVPLQVVKPLPVIKRRGGLGLVDLEALEPMRVDPDGVRATHHDSTEKESP